MITKYLALYLIVACMNVMCMDSSKKDGQYQSLLKRYIIDVLERKTEITNDVKENILRLANITAQHHKDEALSTVVSHNSVKLGYITPERISLLRLFLDEKIGSTDVVCIESDRRIDLLKNNTDAYGTDLQNTEIFKIIRYNLSQPT